MFDVIEKVTQGTVMVAGAGVAGRAMIELLEELGARDIVVADDHGHLPVAEAQQRLGEVDVLLTSPGWAPTSPLLVAAGRKIPVLGDIEFAWLVDRSMARRSGVSPRTWVAITGTNGKTTTTAMMHSMCQVAGMSAEAVGNIGMPPAAVLARDMREKARTDVLVAEVSSFQLHWAPRFIPDVGCVLNVAEDHLDWHGSLRDYAVSKARVLKARRAVVAVDDPAVMSMPRTSNFYAFSAQCVSGAISGAEKVVDVVGGRIRCGDVDIASAEGISPPGPAGIADATAASAMAIALGIEPSAIAAALSQFEVAAHRGQVVHASNGVAWIDNSKATNPHAAEAALRGCERVIWVAGGQLKGASVRELVRQVGPALKGVVALGVDRQIILDEVNRQWDVMSVGVEEKDPEEAMKQVVAAAWNMAEPGDTVILAPAAASLDMYTGMGQRGDLFARYASELAGSNFS